MRSTEKLVCRFFARVDSLLVNPVLSRPRTIYYLAWALEVLGWCQESQSGEDVIPGFEELARRRFDYKLTADVGHWLYRIVKLQLREARKAKSWSRFRFRADRHCRLYIALIGFDQLVRELEGGFNDGQKRSLQVISKGISRKLVRAYIILKRSRHVERWRATARCEHWNSVNPLADFLG